MSRFELCPNKRDCLDLFCTLQPFRQPVSIESRVIATFLFFMPIVLSSVTKSVDIPGLFHFTIHSAYSMTVPFSALTRGMLSQP